MERTLGAAAPGAAWCTCSVANHRALAQTRPPLTRHSVYLRCTQVVLREEETEPRRRTRVIPMLMERDRQRRVRAAAGQAAQ